MTLAVAESTSNETTPDKLPKLPDFLNDLRNISESEIAGRFTIEVTPTDSMNREDYKGNYPRWKFIKLYLWLITTFESFYKKPWIEI